MAAPKTPENVLSLVCPLRHDGARVVHAVGESVATHRFSPSGTRMVRRATRRNHFMREIGTSWRAEYSWHGRCFPQWKTEPGHE
jgi:hypothetical protein